MSDAVYSVTHVVGSSSRGIDDAIRVAMQRASQTLRNLDWFEVTEIRGLVENGQIASFQVALQVGFRLEE